MPSGNVIYEILATVGDAVRPSWELYMQSEHVPEVIAAGGFLGATLERGDGGRYRIRYHAADRDALDRYLATAAPALRRAALARFPEGVTLSRDTWQVVATW